MDVSSPQPDFSLMTGGPLFEAERRLRLVRQPRPTRRRAMLAFVAMTWLPLPLLALLQGGGALRALFSELQVHTELLVSLPVLVAAEPYVDGRISLAVRQFLVSRLVGVGSRRPFEEAVHATMRIRASFLAEAFMWVTAFAFGILSPYEHLRDWMLTGPDGHLGAAGWWYLAWGKPLLRFLMLRWLWRGILWTGFLFRVSRLPLALEPTHPDLMGGLGFLPICQASFSPVVFALAAAVASNLWEVQPGGVVGTPMPYLVPLAVLGGLAALAVCAPLGVFTPQLVRAKRRGDMRFSALAASHSRRFERKWFRTRPPAGEEVLGAPEFSSLIDLGSSFTTARRMRLFLYDTRSLAGLVAAALAPLAVLLILDREFLAVLIQIHEGLP